MLRPTGEVDWWCAPEMDSPPMLWSLLDADGAAARWVDVRLSAASGAAAGPVLGSVLHGAGGRIETRDALHCDDDRGSTLVRLARGIDADLDIVHEVALGGFTNPGLNGRARAPEWVIGRCGSWAERPRPMGAGSAVT